MSIAGVEIAPAVSNWFRENARDLPWRASGYPAWGILVSEIMLQQTPVVRVIPRLELWLQRWPTPADLAASPVGDAVRAWDRLGYPRRAMNLHAAAVAITERHGGVVPETVPELLALPGIGDYTARAVATFAYGHRHPVVDVNVRRVLARAVAGEGEPGPASARRDLPAMEAQLPEEPAAAALANAAVMELGAVVCTARAPRCNVCPLADRCAWRAAGYPEFLGTRSPVQKKFAGSDRQVRGMILAELRASDIPVTAQEISMVWADAVQRERSLASLLTDGLVHITADGNYELPR
jgi:A/G-specific adenine glycosylase